MFRIFIYRSVSYTENTEGTDLSEGLRVVNLSTYNFIYLLLFIYYFLWLDNVLINLISCQFICLMSESCRPPHTFFLQPSLKKLLLFHWEVEGFKITACFLCTKNSFISKDQGKYDTHGPFK